MTDLKSKVKQVRLVEQTSKRGNLYDIRDLFERKTKTNTDSNQKLLEENESTRKANDSLDESNVHVKTLELMRKQGVYHSSLIRPIAKLL